MLESTEGTEAHKPVDQRDCEEAHWAGMVNISPTGLDGEKKAQIGVSQAITLSESLRKVDHLYGVTILKEIIV